MGVGGRLCWEKGKLRVISFQTAFRSAGVGAEREEGEGVVYSGGNGGGDGGGGRGRNVMRGAEGRGMKEEKKREE